MRRILITAIAIVLPTAAQAQSAEADVLATLEKPVPALSVEAVQALNFATVMIPSGIEEGNRCRYIVRPGSGYQLETPPAVFVQEVAPNGGVVASAAPTPSQCAMNGPVGLARFSIACEPTAEVVYGFAYEASGLEGVVLDEDTLGFAAKQVSDGSGAATQLVSGTQGSLTAQCPANGTANLLIGGRLTLDASASATSGTIGAILLTAAY